MTQFLIKSALPKSFSGSVALLFFLTLLTIQAFASHSLKDLYPPPPAVKEEQANRWDPGLFRAITFGQTIAAIDWLWIQVLMDPRIDHVPPGVHPTIYYNLDLITDLDPENFSSYQAGTNLLAIVRNDSTGAEKLIKKGERFRKEELPSFPERFKSDVWRASWQVPLLLAYVELFELDDLVQASGAFQEASKVPGSPEYLKSLTHRLEVPGGEYEVGLRLLNFLMKQHASDEKVLKELNAKRDSLFIGQYVFDLNHEFGSFLKVNPKGKASEEWFHKFLKESRLKGVDPWGGRLFLNDQGRIVTSTIHQKVFGLD